MSNYNYAPGAIHLDHHKDLNIDVKSVDDAIRLMSTFMSDRVEDVTPEYISSPASDNRPKNDFSSVSPESNSDIPLFKYIHYAITSPKERIDIHKQVCNIVRLPKMQLVCDELYDLMKQRKVLCSINPEAMLEDLKRLGLPSSGQSGFSDKNFYRCYRTPKFG